MKAPLSRGFQQLFFRPFGAWFCPLVTHALRRGLHSYAASWLTLVAFIPPCL